MLGTKLKYGIKVWVPVYPKKKKNHLNGVAEEREWVWACTRHHAAVAN